MTTVPETREEAVALDASDPLASARSKFRLPDGVTYLVGHSLGPAPQVAIDTVSHVASEEWAMGMVRSWNTAGWIDRASEVGGQIAPLIGVSADEVVICDSVTINLFKLAAAALKLTARQKIIIENDEFPTDQYIAEGLSELAGVELTKVPAGTALQTLSGGGVLIKSAVNYRTAEIADIETFENAASEAGALIIWDLSHATGIVDIDLSAANALLAAGCTYKYLNGGPGAPAFVYTAKSLVEELQTPLPGWLGHATPFAFSTEYEPASGVERFVAGTPGILSLSALSASLSLYKDIAVQDLHAKAQALGDLCLARAAKIGISSSSPPIGTRRGGHISLRHEDGYAISQALAARGRLTDFRTPDTIRFGFSPLFLSYGEVWDTMDDLTEIIENRIFDAPDYKVRAKVT